MAKVIDFADWKFPGLRDSPNPVTEQGYDVGVIDKALEWLLPDRRRVCVQGGARVGLWPRVLAGHFDQVHAFEPEAQNFACCKANLGNLLDAPRRPSVKLYNAALGHAAGYVDLVVDKYSDGLHHIIPKRFVVPNYQRVSMVTIDSIELDVCDALFLDVEGYELSVLQGAQETIGRCRPLIVAEENNLCLRYDRPHGALEAWLTARGYELVHKWGRVPATRHNPQPGFDLIFRSA